MRSELLFVAGCGMLRIYLLHLVIFAIPLIAGSPHVSIANGNRKPAAVTPALASADLPISELSPSPLGNSSSRHIHTAPPQIYPPDQHHADSVESSTVNTEKSYISLGPLQILGFLFKASNKSHKFNLTSLHSDSADVESLSLASGSSQPSATIEDNKIDGRRVLKAEAAASINPYEHWDADSAEQEAELRVAGGTSSHVDEPAAASTGTSITRSYLLLLAGNATIVRLRRNDFAKYLKMNLAARLSLEYDDVKVNTVLVAPPRLVVNVSVMTPESSSEADLIGHLDDGNPLSEDAPLHMLADTNATLLELSGEEYHVVRLLPLRADPLEFDDGLDLPRTAAAADTRHADIELVIYTVLGGICFIIVLTALLRVLLRRYHSFSHKLCFIPTFFQPWSPASRHQPMDASEELPTVARHDCLAPPTVIYSGSFVSPIGRSAPQSNWMQHIYQSSQPNIIIQDPTPVFTEVKRPFDIDITHHHPSPSKLHIFSCRPGTVVIPLPYHHHTEAMRGLDVREDPCLGHDNPNYQN